MAGVAAPYLVVSGASEVREAAALTLAGAARPGEVADGILAALASEPEPGARLALYDALANQVTFNVDAAVRMVLAEQSPDVQLAGCAALAAEVARRPAAAAAFDAAIVPALVRWAADRAEPGRARSELRALRDARTPAACHALRTVAREASEASATAARAALTRR